MKKYTEKTLHEARESIATAHNIYISCNSMNQPGCQALFTGIEQCIKAPIYEKYGSIPKNLKNHNLISLCDSIGLWAAMSPEQCSLVESISQFTPEVRYVDQEAYRRLTDPTIPIKWSELLATAQTLPDFVEGWITERID